MEYFTVVALIAVPSWNVAPVRRRMVYVKESPEIPPFATLGTSVRSIGTRVPSPVSLYVSRVAIVFWSMFTEK